LDLLPEIQLIICGNFYHRINFFCEFKGYSTAVKTSSAKTPG
jgi:hypothetical protein